MLCALCETFFLSGPVARHTRNESSRYHPSIEALDAAANAGCAFCVKVQAAHLLDRGGSIMYGHDPELDRLEAMVNEANAGGMQVGPSFLDKLRPKDTDFRFPSSPTWWVDTINNENGSRLIAVTGPPITTSASLRPILISFEKGSDEYPRNPYDSDDSDDLSTRFSYLNKTADRAIIPIERSNNLDLLCLQIQKWLEECQHKHPKCQGGGGRQGWLPSRLISIAKGVEDDPCVRLCDSSGIAPGAVYTTLSHCWGPDPAAVGITTTIDNIDQMKTSIPWNKLSKTFQDAIKITSKLKIQYLWIDSLCIIQGSKDDWAKEAGQMQDVYSNSFLNIAATSAPDGRVGCLFDRSPVFSKSAGITLSWDVGDKPSTYFPSIYFKQSELRNTFNQEPLNNRAWVMQERILSPRMLNFTRHQMVWECNSKFIYEALPKPSSQDRTTPDIKMLSLVKESESIDRNIESAVEQYNKDVHSFWWKVVTIYAETSLTKNSDKLVAISGVATRLTDLMSDNYCWGLWEKTLSHDLLWTAIKKSDPSVQLDPTVAPSWSWASRKMTGIRDPSRRDSVRYGREGQLCREYKIDVIEVSRYFVGDEFDPPGPSGELRLKGFLFPIDIWWGESHYFYGYFDGHPWVDGCDVTPDYKYPDARNYRSLGLKKVFCLPTSIRENTSAKYIEGLLIQEHGPRRNYFRRIGLFHFSECISRGRDNKEEKPLWDFLNMAIVRLSCQVHGEKREGGETGSDTGYDMHSVPADDEPWKHLLYGCAQHTVTLI